jgi:hypothetical protein
MKYGKVDFGTTEAVFNKLGGLEGIAKFLRGETTVSDSTQTWREHDGVVYDTVTTNGRTGKEWITYFKAKGTTIGSYAESMILSDDFKPTNGGMIIEFAILKGMLWNDDARSTKNIRTEAENRGLLTPNAELICLIRDKYTDEQIKAMGLLWIIGMHEPIKDSDGDLFWLGANAVDLDCQLNAYNDYSVIKWNRQRGFAFQVSQVSTEVLES